MPTHTSPLSAFTAEPTPLHAVTLAIADGMAQRQAGIDWDYIAQLRKAALWLERLQEWRDAKLLNDLHIGDMNTNAEDQAAYAARETRALHLLLNS